LERVDVVIVGAGIIGLSIAAEISKFKKHVYVIEKHDSFGRETSSRNSEVIHAALYYPPDSLKAKTCLEGNRLTYEICAKNNIPHKKLGKLIVATDANETQKLQKLFDNAAASGAKGIEIISKSKIACLEPNIKADSAIYSENTGIVDSHSLMKFFAFKAQQNGAAIAYNTEVKKITKETGGYRVSITDAGNEEFEFLTEILINCAGLNSDTIAFMAGIDTKKQGYNLKYCKGQYFAVSAKKAKLIHRLVYPVPAESASGLGVHATPNMAGAVRLGPDDEYIKRENIDYSVSEKSKAEFYNSAVKFLPFLELDDLTPDTSGIRPKLQGPGEPFRDFVIKEEGALGLKGFINLIGIESPGLTAAASIAKIVSSLAV